MQVSSETGPATAAAGQISAVVPARNEEDVIGACVESLARQPEIAEIIVVNDGSTDRTEAVLERLLETVPKLRLLKTDGVPPGWVGKNHAAWLGAAEARSPWLLFTDADAEHLDGSAAWALKDTDELALVSFSPEQVMRTWWEKALIPYIYCRLAEKFSYEEVSDKNSPVAAANGQYLMIRREVYEAVGGHRTVAGEILEDVALARRVKSAGYGIFFDSGEGVVRVRMYRTFRAMWEGWRKNLYLLIGGSPEAARNELLEALLVPSIVAVVGIMWHWLALLGLLLFVRPVGQYAGALRRNHFPIALLLYYVPGVALYAAVLLTSWRSYARGRVSWKGREYRVAPPAAESEGR